MNSYSFRITDSFFQNLDLLFELLKKCSNKIIISSETFSIKKDKDVPLHFHGVVTTTLTMSSIRKKVKKYQIQTGNGAYNLKNVTKGGGSLKKSLQYTCKGKSSDFNTVVIAFNYGYSDDDIVQYHKDFWLIYDKTKKIKTHKDKPTFYQIYKSIDDAVLYELHELFKTFKIFEMQERVIKIIIRWYRVNVKCLCNPIAIKCISRSIINTMLYDLQVPPGTIDDAIYNLMYGSPKDAPYYISE